MANRQKVWPRQKGMTSKQKNKLTVLSLVLAAGLLASACEYSELNGIGTRTGDEAAPPQLDLTSFEGCTRGEFGQWDTAGVVTNHTADVASYEVVVGFYAADVRLSQRSRWIRDLKPAESARLDEGFWVGPKADEVTRCEVILINRFD